MRQLTAILLFIVAAISHAQPLPMDSTIRYGKLNNGLTYYICPTGDASEQAHYYIVQRVGSILEEEHQRGLAHFLEHMAFNGTKHFPEKQLIDYLESNGVQFGTDINAYTAFDQTVYSISNVPTQRVGLVDSCLLILHDWSGCISLDAKEIDAERKVIHEEWRTKTGAKDRIYAQTLPKLFPDSNRYAYRMPIGLMEVVDNFSHQALRDYYHKWYRPDLQAIIVAGDVDAGYVEQQIKELWKDIPLRSNAAERTYIEVPDNTAPIVALGTDPELTSGTLRISYKYDPQSPEVSLSLQGRREEYIKSMILSMLSARMADLKQSNDTPQESSIYFFDGDYSIALTKKAFSATATFRGDNWEEAMSALVFQLKRAMEHGFTPEEHERALQQLRPRIGAMLCGEYPTSARNLAERCQAHFLRHQPLLSVTDEAKLYQYLFDDVTLSEINNRFGQGLYTQGGMAILLQGQERPEHQWPTETEVLDAYGRGWMQPTTPYKIPSAEPILELMPERPVAGSIKRERFNKQYGTHELTLSNGAHVILKPVEDTPTLQLNAFSHGGTSLIPDSEYNNINAINALPSMGGLGHLTSRQLGRALEGSSASYRTNVGTLAESLSGSCHAQDTEQLLQLLHLRFTTMRQDSTAFLRWQKSMHNTVSQRMDNPMTRFSDVLRETMYEPHPRSRSLSYALADSVDYGRTCELFHERFANAADFTFIFVGSMAIDTLRPLICQYIASLPATPQAHEKADLSALPALRKGAHTAHVQIPEQQSTTVIYNILARQRHTAHSNVACAILSEVMNSLCAETLREEEGGTYNVSVNARIARQPADEFTLMLNFDTNPEQAEELLTKAIGLLEQVAVEGPSTETFDKARQYLLRRHTAYRGTPSYWMESLTERVRYGSNDMLTTHKALERVTPKEVQRLARKLVKSRHTAKVIMNGAE